VPLEALLRRVSLQVAPEHLRRIAGALEALPAWTPISVHLVQEKVAAALSRRAAAEICSAWKEHAAETPGFVLAAALRVGAGVAEDLRRQSAVDVVWTGPATQAVPVRLTSSALLEVVRASVHSLLLVSFATYRVPEVLEAVRSAAERGVRISMVAETVGASRGKLSFDDIAAYRAVPSLDLYVWPHERRPQVGVGVASMHVKAAVADATHALIGSANLTGSALALNMEMGVLVRGGDIPERLVRHFNELIARGELRAVAEHEVAASTSVS
jgi:phosphatidylserine/phosphatidylglycerophosphate/cardiolipin synthase-like enzyme